MTFKQQLFDNKTNKLYVEATVKVVAVHNDGKLYKNLPEAMVDFIGKCKNEPGE